MQMTRSSWFMPAVAAVLGALLAAALWAGGDPTGAVIAFVVMALFALAILLGGRSETVRAIRGDGRDERFSQIDLRATALTGVLLILAVIVAFAVEVAQGRDGAPFNWLGALAGVGYLACFLVFRLRG